MPRKRKLEKIRNISITPQMIDAFKRNDSDELDRLLGLKPWQMSPLHADAEEPPAWMLDTLNAERWKFARGLRRELEKELKQCR